MFYCCPHGPTLPKIATLIISKGKRPSPSGAFEQRSATLCPSLKENVQLLNTCQYYIRISIKNLQCTDIGRFFVGFPTQNQLFLHFPTQNEPFPSYINFWANRCFIIDVIHHCLHHFDASDFDRDLCSHLLPSQCCHHCCASDFDAHFCSGTDRWLRFFCDTCCLLESKTCTVCGLTFVV